MSCQHFPLDGSFRFRNYRDYIQGCNEVPKISNYCVLILTFNNLESLKLVCSYVVVHDTDIVIVDNHSIDGTYDFLLAHYASRINLIKLNENLGGAGGFAVGQEWVIDRQYDFCIISEDDAIPGSQDIIPQLMNHASQERIVQTKYAGLKNQLFALHFALYPVRIFKHAGVMNRHLFSRGDDYEYGMRLQRAAKALNIKPLCLDEYYEHPYLKLGYGVAPIYFAIRNQLLIYAVQGNYIAAARFLFKYICYGFHALIEDRNRSVIKLVGNGIIDYLFCRFSRNSIVMHSFGNATLKPKPKPMMQKLTWEQFGAHYSSYSSQTKLTNLFPPGLLGNRNGRLSLNSVIAAKYSQPNRMAAFLAKRAVFIEEIDLHNHKLKCFELKTANRFLSIAKLSISSVLASFLWIIIAPLVIFRGFAYHKRGKGFYLKGNPFSLFHRDTNTQAQL